MSNLAWDKEAVAAVERAPFFVRRMVRKKVEEYVAGLGKTQVTAADVQAARQHLLGGGTPPVAAKPTPVPPEPTATAGPTLDVPLSETELRAVERLAQEKAGIDTRYYAVRNCGGAVGCPLNVADVESLAIALAERLAASGIEAHLKATIKGPVLTHHKFRVVLAGCANNCSEPQIADFSVVAQARPTTGPGECSDCGRCLEVCKEGAITLVDGPHFDYERCLNCGRCEANCATEAIATSQKGFDVLVGGKLGRHARLASRVLVMADEATVLRAFDASLAFYLANANGPERFGAVLERTGLESLQARLM
ncbi:MAG: 4Fe-4S dicluster domain-containing protein [Chloroflexota bacterium]